MLHLPNSVAFAESSRVRVGATLRVYELLTADRRGHEVAVAHVANEFYVNHSGQMRNRYVLVKNGAPASEWIEYYETFQVRDLRIYVPKYWEPESREIIIVDFPMNDGRTGVGILLFREPCLGAER